MPISDINKSLRHVLIYDVQISSALLSELLGTILNASELSWGNISIKRLIAWGVKSRTWNAFNLSPVKSRIRARFLSKRPFTKFEAKIGLFIRRGCKNRKNLPPWMPATIIIAKAVNGRKFIFRYNRGKIFAEVSEPEWTTGSSTGRWLDRR